jgi:carbamoylphosphate synthase large subunit
LLHHHLDFDTISPEKLKDYDLVVPLTMTALREMHEFPQPLNNHLIPIPSLKAINICDDKALFSKTLVEKGFGNFLPRTGKGLDFPYILKKNIAWGANSCYFITNPEQEQQHSELISSEDYHCQEIIKGKSEFDAHILYKNHHIVASLGVENSFENDVYLKGKDNYICTKIVKCPYLDLFADILEAIGFEGLCCFNYKENDGKPSIFEINPRFDGSLSRYFFTFIRELEREKVLQAS